MKAVLPAAALLFFAFVGVSRWRGRVSYEQRLAALHAAGAPICAADFAKLYPDPPVEKNFRHLLRSVLPPGSSPWGEPAIEIGAHYWSTLRGLSHEQPVPTTVLDAIHAASATNQPVLDLLLRTDLSGFGFAHCWATEGFTNNSEADGDKIFLRIDICPALVCLAANEAHAGHPERACLALVRGAASRPAALAT